MGATKDDQELEAGFDPFKHHLELSPSQKLVVIVNSFWLAPLRLIVIALLLLIINGFCFIGSLGLSEQQLSELPMQGWRSCVQNVVKVLLRCVYFVSGIHYVVMRGKKAPPDVAPILVGAPHCSIADILPTVMTNSRPVNKGGIGELIASFLQVSFATARCLWPFQ